MIRIFQSARPSALLLACLLAGSLATGEPERNLPDQGCGSTPQVHAIRDQAGKVDQLFDAPEPPGFHHLEKQSSRWQFTGLLDKDSPVYLSAEFSEGDLVRRESYYLVDGQLILVDVDRWWDVDNPRKAPEPRKYQQIYVNQGQSVCTIWRTDSKPPVVRSDSIARPSGKFSERYRLIASILTSESKDRTRARPLQEFPEDEPPPK